MLFPHKLLNSNLESITCEVLVNFMDWFLKKMTGIIYYLAYLLKDMCMYAVRIILKIFNATLSQLISLNT